MKNRLKSAIKTLLIKANTVVDKSVFDCLNNIKDEDKKSLIIKNCQIAKETSRPLCQDTGQVMVFLKLPYDFAFGFDFKKVINEAVEEVYKNEYYRKSVVKNALFDRTNTTTNTPAIIYTDFEERKFRDVAEDSADGADVVAPRAAAAPCEYREGYECNDRHDEHRQRPDPYVNFIKGV